MENRSTKKEEISSLKKMTEQLVPSENIPRLAPPVSIFDMHMTYFTDTTGIPLDSNRRVENPHTASIEFELQKCPFTDSPSRYPDGAPHEKPMSGLERRRLNEHYQQNLSAVKYLRNIQVASREDGDTTRPLSIRETRDLLSAMAFLPHYLVYRAENALQPTGEIPVDILLDASVALGAFAATTVVVQNEKISASDFEFASFNAERLVEESEKAGIMVGEQTVCVASPKQMTHFLREVIEGPSVELGLGNIEALLNPEEFADLLKLGKSMMVSNHIVASIIKTDSDFSNKFEPLLDREKLQEAGQLLQEYQKDIKEYFELMHAGSTQVQEALGRKPQKRSIFAQEFMMHLALYGTMFLEDIIR